MIREKGISEYKVKAKKSNSVSDPLRTVTVFAMVCLLFAALVLPAAADSLSYKKQKLYRVRKNLRKVKNKLHYTTVRKNDISRQLYRTQNQIRTLKGDITYLNSKITSSRSNIRQLRSELASLQKRHSEKQALFQERLKDIYLNDENSFIEVLDGSKNFSEFVNHTDYLGLLCEADEQLIKTLRIEQEAIRFKQNQINNKYRKMLSYRGRLKTKEESLHSIEDKREELLDEVEKEQKYYKRRKYELEEHTYELEQEVQRLIRAYQRRNRTSSSGSHTPAHSTGRFRWPTGGYITSNFGWRHHPVYGRTRFHSGIDLGVGWGSPVKAADGGRVIYSGWCGGYGYTVMIDHGRGLTTLYGHCSKLYVNVGQSVAKGQVVSAVGSTGVSTGPHLHFEVRQNGNPVNPMGFLR